MGHASARGCTFDGNRHDAVSSGRGLGGDRNCRLLKGEAQNTNVPACRFYRRMGCTLASIDRFAYAGLLDEMQLVWIKEL